MSSDTFAPSQIGEFQQQDEPTLNEDSDADPCTRPTPYTPDYNRIFPRQPFGSCLSQTPSYANAPQNEPTLPLVSNHFQQPQHQQQPQQQLQPQPRTQQPNQFTTLHTQPSNSMYLTPAFAQHLDASLRQTFSTNASEQTSTPGMGIPPDPTQTNYSNQSPACLPHQQPTTLSMPYNASYPSGQQASHTATSSQWQSSLPISNQTGSYDNQLAASISTSTTSSYQYQQNVSQQVSLQLRAPDIRSNTRTCQRSVPQYNNCPNQISYQNTGQPGVPNPRYLVMNLPRITQPIDHNYNTNPNPNYQINQQQQSQQIIRQPPAAHNRQHINLLRVTTPQVCAPSTMRVLADMLTTTASGQLGQAVNLPSCQQYATSNPLVTQHSMVPNGSSQLQRATNPRGRPRVRRPTLNVQQTVIPAGQLNTINSDVTFNSQTNMSYCTNGSLANLSSVPVSVSSTTPVTPRVTNSVEVQAEPLVMNKSCQASLQVKTLASKMLQVGCPAAIMFDKEQQTESLINKNSDATCLSCCRSKRTRELVDRACSPIIPPGPKRKFTPKRRVPVIEDSSDTDVDKSDEFVLGEEIINVME